MAKSHDAGSAALPKLIRAFGGLFVILVTCFEPTTAFIGALIATGYLSKL